MAGTQEIDAIQRWLFQATGLRSLRISEQPPTLARPVVLWELPGRMRTEGRRSRFTRSSRVRAFGRLYVRNMDEHIRYSEYMDESLDRLQGLLPVYESEAGDAPQIGWLKNAEIEFTEASDMNPQIVLTYEVSYLRPQPFVPHANTVTNTIQLKE